LGELGGAITVTKSFREVRGELKIGATKTGCNRVVPIPRFLSEMLKGHIERYSDGHVFTAHECGPIRHRNFMRRHFDPAIAQARKESPDDGDPIPENLRIHDLRDTFAALNIAKGCNMEELKYLMGHGSIRTTSDTYVHLFKAAKAALADALEATFRTSQQAVMAEPRPKNQTPTLRSVR
jgi:integrase